MLFPAVPLSLCYSTSWSCGRVVHREKEQISEQPKNVVVDLQKFVENSTILFVVAAAAVVADFSLGFFCCCSL